MPVKKISLYECAHALVLGDKICCEEGHNLDVRSNQIMPVLGCISINRLIRGEPLCMEACQNCPDFERIGEPIKPKERGWLFEPDNPNSRKIPYAY